MKTERNILTAFILNLGFSIFEFFGGIITGSVAIISDAIHDMGDAAVIGLSYFLEKKSKKPADEKHPKGYAHYSELGGIITTICWCCCGGDCRPYQEYHHRPGHL